MGVDAGPMGQQAEGTITFARDSSVGPLCVTNNNVRTITCGALQGSTGMPRTFTKFVAVHELGHIFDDQSAQGGQIRLSDFVSNASITDSNILWVMGWITTNGCPPGSNVFAEDTTVLRSNNAGQLEVWRRGERGWGSGPGSFYNPPTQNDRCVQRSAPNFTDFQQNPDQASVDESAADMFLNWVYRLQSGGVLANVCDPLNQTNPGYWTGQGFLNRDWRNQMSDTPTSGLLDGSLPGDNRFFWMHEVVDDIFDRHPW